MDGGANDLEAGLTAAQLEKLKRLRDDFTFYAPRMLKVKVKDPAAVPPVQPLILNRAQRFVHQRLEHQLSTTGRVRAILLKGRQMGMSTLIEARLFHKVSMNRGRQAFILTHEQDATDTLFAMTSRYYENLPQAFQMPLGQANAKSMVFEGRESGYSVATAGGKAVGRSKTAHYFHGSEVAFWPNGPTHMMGVGQIIPDLDGTEIILESTANGYDSLFYPMWQAAERGESSYQAIFTPWFWDDGYRKKVPKGYEFSPEDREYQQAHGIDDEQLYWRRSKINDDLGKDEQRFAQEYPATAAEAFVAFTGSLIKAEYVVAARKRHRFEAIGPRIVGVDPAGGVEGKDSTAIVDRIGRVVLKAERHHNLNTMGTANLVMHRLANEPDIAAVFIDFIGIGQGVYDRCIERGWGHKVFAVKASERATTPEAYFNKRAECWGRMKDAFEFGLQIPDQDDFQTDLLAPQFTYEGGQRLKLESKDHMKARGVKSPDKADALSLTYAEPVFPTNKDDDVDREHARDGSRSDDWRVN